MNETVEKIHVLLFNNLLMSSPILSGNMKSNIKQEVLTDGTQIIIDAPFYDFKTWVDTGAIVQTGEIIDGQLAYAYDVNQYGGFGTHNKSEGWVNRAILQVVRTIANEIGAEVIYEL